MHLVDKVHPDVNKFINISWMHLVRGLPPYWQEIHVHVHVHIHYILFTDCVFVRMLNCVHCEYLVKLNFVHTVHVQVYVNVLMLLRLHLSDYTNCFYSSRYHSWQHKDLVLRARMLTKL